MGFIELKITYLCSVGVIWPLFKDWSLFRGGGLLRGFTVL